eukprot:scaffold26320_cov83-Skeletonema_marinoi.AAC.2
MLAAVSDASSGHLRQCSDADAVKMRRVMLAAVSDASSGHLRQCSDADTTNHCLSRREIRYCAREYCSRPSQMPHQVTYDVVAALICPNIA